MNRIETYTPSSERLGSLLGGLEQDVKQLVKKELDLAKTEMGEKFGALGRNAGLAAGGGVLLLFAAFFLLLGAGAILARLLIAAGLSPGASYFLGFATLALLLGGVGYALLHKAMKAFSNLSLSPEKALGVVRGPQYAASEAFNGHARASEKEMKPSSDELQDEVLATRSRMDSEWAELKSRLTPGYVFKSSMAGIKHHPLRALFVGATTGVGSYLYWRRQQQVKLDHLNAHRKWWQFKIRHM
jgi:hypothetical protein